MTDDDVQKLNTSGPTPMAIGETRIPGDMNAEDRAAAAASMAGRKPKKELKPCPRMTDDEIADVVRGLVAGSIFTGAQCPPELLPLVFTVLSMSGLGDIDPTTVGMVYEHMDKAGPRAINGYPMFFSCRLAHRDDWAVIAERAIAAQEALDRAAAGEK